MLKKSTNTDGNSYLPEELTSSAFELVNWSPASLNKKILALQTCRLSPISTETATPFGNFNLGLHVGDNAKLVVNNRGYLTQFINQELRCAKTVDSFFKTAEVAIQWLDQVHGNDVAVVNSVSDTPVSADASITREKHIALAIMTADCLPILLSNRSGNEIAAIHGGWRPLAANILNNTLTKMHSKPSEVVAWLGPCIGKAAFEVGREVKEIFTRQSEDFELAFTLQENGKYLADLQLIARLQLEVIGISTISALEECTYQKTDKYYSYRKKQITGRMASIICLR